MKEENQNRNRGLLKGLIVGPIIGAFLGFLVLFLITGKLPFAESDSMSVVDLKGLVAIFYLYSIVGGAILGYIVGVVIGSIVDFLKK